MNNFKISIVIPAYNEEENVSFLYQKIIDEMKKYTFWELIFINDGSIDGTLKKIKELSFIDSHVRFISFSRNFGHQNALKAGLDFAKGDCVITMDADLQHSPKLIHQMIEKWQEGYDIVYTIRQVDKKLSFFKRSTSFGFYKIMNMLSEIKMKEGVADFRLMDKKVVEVFRNDINEYFIFIRGMISWVGFKQFAISYTPNDRMAGKPKYTLRKMFIFAVNGITSFSTRPLKLSLIFGFIFSFIALCYALYALYIYFFSEKVVSGWASVIISVLLIGGIQMILTGIQGEYLGKIFLEIKKRPHYIVSESNIIIKDDNNPKGEIL